MIFVGGGRTSVDERRERACRVFPFKSFIHELEKSVRELFLAVLRMINKGKKRRKMKEK